MSPVRSLKPSFLIIEGSTMDVERIRKLYEPKVLTRNASQSRAYRAVMKGIIPWGENCEDCGIPWELTQHGLEMHHEDYQKPLEVTWLCVSCHRKRSPRK